MPDVAADTHHAEVRDFLDEIAEERAKGLGFIPLVGAGLSAPSGIPIITEVRIYLQKCISLALGIDRLGKSTLTPKRIERFVNGVGSKRRWLPGRDNWPSISDPLLNGAQSEQWIFQLGEIVAAMSHHTSKRHPEEQIYQEAYGAAAEWRSALLFLSRLRLKWHDASGLDQDNGQKNEHERYRLILGAQSPDVIDTFFLQVEIGKRSTLGHKQLALLAGPLRINTVLTTNFDDLLEQAFSQVGNVFTPFDVHVDAGLPSHRDIFGQNAIIKLHGTRYGLRADYSLDDPPSDSDRRHFVEYVADRHIGEAEWQELRRGSQAGAKSHAVNRAAEGVSEPLVPKRHLLVVGFSGNDERVNLLLQTAIDVFNEDLRIFWICFTDQDKRQVASLQNRFLNRKRRHSKEQETKQRLLVLRHPFFGLLFLQLYQHVMKTLPASEAVFPSAAQVSVPPEFVVAQPALPTFRKVLTSLQRKIEKTLLLPEYRTVVLTGPPNKLFGAVSVAAKCFDRLLNDGKQCVWIDLDEIGSTNELFEVMVQAAARKAGVVDWMPVLLHRTLPLEKRIADAQIHEMARLTRGNRKWVVFLNARSGPGANLIRQSNYAKERELRRNGWMDVVDARAELKEGAYFDATASGVAFADLVERLCRKTCPNVTVVLLCFDGQLTETIADVAQKPLKLNANCLKDIGTVDKIVERALEWCGNLPQRSRFLLATCLANRVRYPTMLSSTAFVPTGIGASSKDGRTSLKTVEDWLKELDERHVIRRKLGGFVWLNCDVRNRLREDIPKQYLAGSSEPWVVDAAEIHSQLAEWNQDLFHASHEPPAAFDAIYHFCMEVRQRLSATGNDLPEATLDRILSTLSAVRRLLEVMRNDSLSAGFSKGLCRRLEQLRDELVAPLTSLVKDFPEPTKRAIERRAHGVIIASLALNRAIAQEVGENVVAFLRNREIIHARHQFCVTDESRVQSSEKAELRLVGGTLGIATRAYEFAEKQFDTCLNHWGLAPTVMNAETPPSADMYFEWKRKIRDRLARRSMKFAREREQQTDRPISTAAETDDDRNRAGRLSEQFFQMVSVLVRTLMRRQQLELAWGQSVHLQGARDDKGRQNMPAHHTAVEHFQRAWRCYELAMEMMKWLHKDDIREVWGEGAARENWQRWYAPRIRIQTQAALAKSFLRDFETAHRLLNRAESELEEAGYSGSGLERAVIDLHRAEVLTHQAVFGDPPEVPNSSYEEGMSHLGVMRRIFLHRCWQSDHKRPARTDRKLHWEDVLKQNDERYWRTTQELRKSLSFVDDAWQTLARAERLLQQNRKNVWWTTWFFELKMKLVELRVFGCLTSPIALSIPHVGLENAPQGLESVIDRLLDDSERMIRLDVFRSARIVECYVNTMLGVVAWQRRAVLSSSRRLQSYARALENRVKQMQRRIPRATLSLKRRLRRRLELDRLTPTAKQGGPLETTPLDETVKNYAEFVRQYSKWALSWSRVGTR